MMLLDVHVAGSPAWGNSRRDSIGIYRGEELGQRENLYVHADQNTPASHPSLASFSRAVIVSKTLSTRRRLKTAAPDQAA